MPTPRNERHEQAGGQAVALYAKYSSDQQREASLDDQLRRCREFITDNGGVVDERLVFQDAAVSGGTMARPSMRRLQAAIDAGVVDVIVVDDGSRLSRDLANSVLFFRRLRCNGVMLYWAADGLDTSAPNAKLNRALKALLSDYFLEEQRRCALTSEADVGNLLGHASGYRRLQPAEPHPRERRVTAARPSRAVARA